MSGLILGNGIVTFGDGTRLGSATIPYGNITNRYTNLTQFTNDLGNYGNFFTASSIDATQIGCGAWPSLALTVTNCGSSTTLGLATNNCNCNCNCNC